MKKRKSGEADREHAFGGGWTKAKLDVLAQYLRAYTKALKNQPFRKGYIDAFAGTGYREVPRRHATGLGAHDLPFPDLAQQDSQDLLEGSASLALRTAPPFDSYVFIERSAKRCARLEELKTEFPALADSIQIRRGDANELIQALCRKKWTRHRAVLFLDPYGMQVKWKTIERIASTKAIDLWVLFPLGMGVNRLLKRSGKIPPRWRACLNELLGTTDWYEEFYRVERLPTLYDDSEDRVVKAGTETIGRYFNQRLSSVFVAVAPVPRVLRNSRNAPLYLLCFAASNEKGAPVALKIANDLLKNGAN